jgi:endoribonuclease Dicer
MLYKKIIMDNNDFFSITGLFFEGHGKIIASLYMPHLTPYREPFIGDPKGSKKKAKRNVAMKVVKCLHQDGLLDDSLLPRKKILALTEDELDCGDQRKPKPGTKRSKAYYLLQVPKEMIIVQAKQSWLYKIGMKLIQASSHSQNVKQYSVYNPEDYPRKIGLVLGQQIPAGCLVPFDLFTLTGQLQVHLELVGEMPDDQTGTTSLAKEFHSCAMEDIIGFNKDIVKSCQDLETDPWIVPLNDRNQLDVEFLSDWKEKFFAKLKSNKKAKQFLFKKEDFVDAVVIPQHRRMENFIVEEVVQDRSPESLLPKHASETYQELYENNWGCQITDLEQPLLRISNADKHHFMFAPISNEATNNNEQLKADRDKFLSKRTLLVPELVKIHPIPASMWREIQMVPFVMVRLSSLIKVHDMMSEMKSGVGSFYKKPNRTQEASNKSLPPSFHQLIQTNLERKKLDIWDILEAVTLRGAGEVFDMEKLEVLGDSFLKFIVSIALFANKVNYFTTFTKTTLKTRKPYTIG